MRKFKHKITGKVFIETDFCNPEAPNESYYKLDSVARNFYLEKEFIVGSNDYVEIKEESNYLITAFREINKSNIFKNCVVKINANGLFLCSMKVDEMLKGPTSVEDGSFEIYSVKNSKGEEWILSDKFDTEVSKNCIITKFEIIDNVIGVYAEGKHGFLELDWLIKVKQPLYTTTDGVDIYEGDGTWLWLLSKDLSTLSATTNVFAFSKNDKEVADRYLTFTSEENRDKYIKENARKAIFTSADGKEIFEGDRIYMVTSKFEIHDNPCNKYDGRNLEYFYFSTKEKAIEWLYNNKPKYSLKDIESCYPSPLNSPLYETLMSNLKKLGK